MHQKHETQSGFILLLTLMIVTISIIMVTQLATRSTLQVSYDTTIIAREKAKALALSGIQLAMGRLYIEPKDKDQKKDAAQAQEKQSVDATMELLMRTLPELNQWQGFELKQEIDGLDGRIQFSISSEEGKIDLNALYDFQKKDFVSPEAKKIAQAVFAAAGRLAGGRNLFNAFTTFVKERKMRLQDPSELLKSKEFQKTFAGKVFFEPPAAGQKEKRPIFLNDIFTVSSRMQKVSPITLSDSVQALFGLNRADSRASQSGKKEVQELLKKIKTIPTDIEKLWLEYLKKLYGKEFKSLPKDLVPLLAVDLSFRNFTVVSYGTVQQVTQKVVAIIERQERSFIVRKLYWL